MPTSSASLRIAVYAFDGVTMFHLAVPQMVFGEVSRQGLGKWDTALFSDRPGSVRSAEGYRISDILGPESAQDADVVVVPSWFDDHRPVGVGLRRLLVGARDRGATVVGLCLGAFPLADAGLLSGRSAVTHWRSTEALAAQHPDVEVDADVLYIDHGDVLTSAGTASGLDACLHLVRSRLGAAAAVTVARQLVVAPHRGGGQAQYVERPLPARSTDDPLSRVLEWALENLTEPLTVDQLASVAHLSRRTFIRSFQATTGTSPAAWVKSQRLDEARRLLETTDLPVDEVAAASGLGSPATLRQGFARAFGTSPTDYRRRFGTRPAPR